MGAESPSDDRSRGLGAFAAGGLSTGSGAALAFARMPELEALERGALAAAVHPAGAGFERAWLFVWDARSGLLEGRDSAVVPVSPPSLGEWLECQAPPRLELETRLRPPALRPHRLAGAVARAWNPGGVTPATEPETGVPWAGAPHVGAIALRRARYGWALVVGTWGAEPGPEQRTALETIGVLCGRAAQALDQEREGRRRAHQAASLAQAVRVLGATLNLAEVLQKLTRLAAQGTESRGSALWRAGTEGLRLEVTHGLPGRRERTGLALQALAGAVVEEAKPRVVDRSTAEPLLAPEAAAEVDSVVVCPLRVYGRVLGALACYDRATLHRSDATGFTAADVEFVSALAELAALSLDQAGRFTEVHQAEQRRRELVGRLQRQEQLAWQGELAGRMAQEARNPLASIEAFARRAQRSIAAEDPNHDYLEIILREAGRLGRLLSEQSGYAPPAEGALKLVSLNAVVQEALTGAADALVSRRVRLVKRLSPDLPALLLDHERIRRVIANILGDALEAVGVGGRIRLESRRLGTSVQFELAHDGPRSPGDLLEQVFVPFASQRPGGPAVGLGVAQQVVREHGGEVRVRSDGEWGTVFSLSFPIHENQDRRHAGADRRRARRDRRTPRPER